MIKEKCWKEQKFTKCTSVCMVLNMLSPWPALPRVGQEVGPRCAGCRPARPWGHGISFCIGTTGERWPEPFYSSGYAGPKHTHRKTPAFSLGTVLYHCGLRNVSLQWKTTSQPPERHFIEMPLRGLQQQSFFPKPFLKESFVNGTNLKGPFHFY